MSGTIFTWLLTSVFLIAVPVAEAQRTGKVPLIGVLGSGTAADPRNKASLETLRDGLHEFGYTEGKTISFEPRFAERNIERLPELADELIRLKVDIILAIDSNAARAAKQSTPTVSIVIVTGGDPVRNKLVTSLARPGANVTGLTTDSPRLADKRLGLLKESFRSSGASLTSRRRAPGAAKNAQYRPRRADYGKDFGRYVSGRRGQSTESGL